MPETAIKILSLPHDDQKRWVESQDWYQKEGFEQTLYDADITGLAVQNLEEDLSDLVTHYQKYGTSGILLENGFITEDRANELEDFGNFDEEEKNQIRQCLIDRAIGNGDVHEARSLSVDLDGKEVLVTFQGTYHPQHGLEVQFLGIFENRNQIEKAMGSIGVVIENFMEGLVLND